MSKVSVVFQEDTSKMTVNQAFEKLTTLGWFKEGGRVEKEIETLMEQFLKQFNIKQYEMKWLHKEELIEVIERFSFQGSDIWNELKEIPDHLKQQISANNDDSYLERLVDILPEAVFHPVFDGAFKQYSEEKTIRFLTGNAMYFALLICIAELASKGDLFQPIFQIIERGHVPVGIEGNMIYLL